MDLPDLHRIFLGDNSWTYTFEIAFRTVVMYGYTLFLVRLLTSRTVGQLSLIEFLLVIALGSAVGDPMFYDDVPILHGMLVVTVVVFMNRGLYRLVRQNERIERFIEGSPLCVVRDGAIDFEALRRAQWAVEELYETLRLHGVEQLGEVRAAYIEQNGQVSVFRYRGGDVPVGLSIEPPSDLR